MTKRSSYECSEEDDTVEQRCYLNLLFVFQTTLFTSIDVVANDRGGSSTTFEVDYSSEDLSRSGEYIIIPGIDEPTAIDIPPYIIDLIAVIIALWGTYSIFKKTEIDKKKIGAIYGKR